MSYMHFTNGHHSDSHHSMSTQPTSKSLILDQGAGNLPLYTFSSFHGDVGRSGDFNSQNCS